MYYIDLKKYRDKYNLTQNRLAELTDINRAIISKYENKIGVTKFLTKKLLESIPDLKNFIVEDEETEITMASESIQEYGYSGSGMMRIIEEQALAIRELTTTNKQLTDMLNECLTRKHKKDHVLNN